MCCAVFAIGEEAATIAIAATCTQPRRATAVQEDVFQKDRLHLLVTDVSGPSALGLSARPRRLGFVAEALVIQVCAWICSTRRRSLP